jgi:hypothetical protein
MVGQDGEINWNFTVQFYQKVGFWMICHEFKNQQHNLTFQTPIPYLLDLHPFRATK